jgi:putative addiction module CopG family antidote
MTIDLPPDVQQFLDDEVASGTYRNKEELVTEAVRLLRDGSRRFQEFRDELPARVARLKRGEGIELEDDRALEEFFDEIEAEAAAEPAKDNAPAARRLRSSPSCP